MNTLFSTIVGSKLYGIDTEESDTDIKGFGLPELKHIIGYGTEEQEDYKNGEGKDKVESTIYTLKKFLYLAIKSNPTIIEIAFTDPKFHVIATPLGLEVCQFIRENILSKNIYPAYRGYIKSQIHKLEHKKYDDAIKRKELIEKYGYDTKHAAHSYRAIVQLQELLIYGKGFNPTLSDLKIAACLSIRAGMFDFKYIVAYLKGLDATLENCLKLSPLPADIDREKVEGFLVDIHAKYVKGEI